MERAQGFLSTDTGIAERIKKWGKDCYLLFQYTSSFVQHTSYTTVIWGVLAWIKEWDIKDKKKSLKERDDVFFFLNQ